jgi:hypothetical protein
MSPSTALNCSRAAKADRIAERGLPTGVSSGICLRSHFDSKAA